MRSIGSPWEEDLASTKRVPHVLVIWPLFGNQNRQNSRGSLNICPLFVERATIASHSLSRWRACMSARAAATSRSSDDRWRRTLRSSIDVAIQHCDPTVRSMRPIVRLVKDRTAPLHQCRRFPRDGSIAPISFVARPSDLREAPPDRKTHVNFAAWRALESRQGCSRARVGGFASRGEPSRVCASCAIRTNCGA